MSQRNIICGPCGNRRFANREILAHHLKTSSQWHPTCAKCDRRFTSSVAYEAHMSSKHPFRYKCSLCCRDFAENFQLQDHFRGSDVHPNCPRCGKGFADAASLNSHRTTAHVKVQCEPCQETIYKEDLVVHYTTSTSGKHPKCPVCEMGCKDDGELKEHVHTHAEADAEASAGSPPLPSQEAPSDSGASLSVNTSPEDTSPTRRFPLLEAASPVNPNLKGPLISSASLPPAKSWGPLANPLIRKDLLGSDGSRTDTPPLQLSMAFSSPLMKVKQPVDLYTPATPAGLAPPSPELNRAWNSRENRVSPPKDTAPAPTSEPTINGPWTPLALDKRASGGALEWRKSGIVRPSIQPSGDSPDPLSTWAVARPAAQSRDSSTGAYWIKSRLYSARQSVAAHNGAARTLEPPQTQSTSTDVVKWRALLGEEDGLGTPLDTDETPRAGSPTTAAIDEIGEGSDPMKMDDGLKPDVDLSPDLSPHDHRDHLDEERSAGPTAEYQAKVFGTAPGNPLGYHGRTASENSTPESSSSADGQDAMRMDSPPTTVSTSLSSCAPPALSPLHCRQCKADPCEDITATMCGHVFCYKCITSAVIQSPKCPVCSTPTLLYCLFRLDLKV